MTDITVATRNKKISAGQFFSIIFISRTFATLTYIVPNGEIPNSSDKVAHIALSIIVSLISFIPMYFFVRSNRELSIIERAGAISPIFAKIVAIAYYVLFLLLMIFTTLRFEMFASSVMFPEAELNWFLLIIFALALYVAFLGIEAIARASSFFAVITFAALVFLCFLLIPRFDILNMTPVFYDGVKLPLKAAVYSAARAIDISFIFIFLPKIKGSIKKNFTIGFSAIIVLSLGLTLILAGVLGKYGDTQMFQFYSIVGLAEIGIFQRLDAVQTSVWILCAFLKIALYLYVSYDILCIAFKFKWKKSIVLLSTLVSFICVAFISESVQRFSISNDPVVMEAAYAIFVVALPVIVMLAERTKRRKTG